MKKEYRITLYDDYYYRAVVWAENEVEAQEIAQEQSLEDFEGSISGEPIKFLFNQERFTISLAGDESKDLPRLNEEGKSLEYISEIIDNFLELSKSEVFSIIKKSYKNEIALACLAYDDNLRELANHAIKLYDCENEEN